MTSLIDELKTLREREIGKLPGEPAIEIDPRKLLIMDGGKRVLMRMDDYIASVEAVLATRT